MSSSDRARSMAADDHSIVRVGRAQVLEANPDTRVVMLTASWEEKAVVEGVAAGATGYLQKEASRDRLLATVRAVYRGELRVPAAVVLRVFAAIREAGTADPAEAAGLTPKGA